MRNSMRITRAARSETTPGTAGGSPHNLLSRFLHRPGFLCHLRSFNGYDGPEILPSSTHPICLIGADAGHGPQGLEFSVRARVGRNDLTQFLHHSPHLIGGRLGMTGKDQFRGRMGQIPPPVGLRDDGGQSEKQRQLPRLDHNTRRGQSAEALPNATHQGSNAVTPSRQHCRAPLCSIDGPGDRGDEHRMRLQPVIHASTQGDLKARFRKALRDTPQTLRKAAIRLTEGGRLLRNISVPNRVALAVTASARETQKSRPGPTARARAELPAARLCMKRKNFTPELVESCGRSSLTWSARTITSPMS